MCQQKTFHPVLHVLQNPAVGQFVPGSLDSKPVQTLGRVVLDHLEENTQERSVGLFAAHLAETGEATHNPD